MSHSISVNTTEHDVHSVCVFQSNHAEIKRNLQVELRAGQNEVRIEKLPNCLQGDSIRVEGVGNAVIFDVIYSPPPPTDTETDRADERAALKDVEEKIAALELQKSAAEGQAGILEEYSKTLNAKKTDATALEGFLEMYVKKKAAIHSDCVEIGNKIAVLQKDAGKKRTALWQDVDGMKRAVRVTVIVLAETDGKADLSLSYMVSDASWTPLYDIRAKVPNSPNEPSSIALQYRASICQNTGEDWKEVELTLSTALPLISSNVPELPPYRIGTPIRRTKSMRKAKGFSFGASMGSYAEEEVEVEAMSAAPMMRSMVHRTAAAIESAVSTSFIIEGQSTIPSDSKSDQQSHKVSIALIDLQAKLEWIAIPKQQATAFLRAQVKNTSDYVLLPGPTNVFMNDNFVCKSTVSHVSPQESFSTSLGVDASIKITYHNLQKKTTAHVGSIIGAKSDVTSFIQRITIKNNRRAAVAPLYVKDNIPVSEASAFKVTLHEPKELGPPRERKEVAVAQGVKARWSFKGDPSGEDSGYEKDGLLGGSTGGKGGVEEDGTVEWVCDIAAGKAAEIALAYDISAPVGQGWARV